VAFIEAILHGGWPGAQGTVLDAMRRAPDTLRPGQDDGMA
jgi:hypothetical protein